MRLPLNLNEDDLRNSHSYWHQDNDAVSHLITRRQRSGFTGAGRTANPQSGEKAFADSQKGHLNASALERMFQKSFFRRQASAD